MTKYIKRSITQTFNNAYIGFWIVSMYEYMSQ